LNSKINVFLVAGCRLFREALSRILGSKNDLCVVGSAPHFPEAVSGIESSGCDVLLVDPINGESCDLSLVDSVSRTIPATRMILINMVEDEATFLKAVCAGADGYLLQHASAADVVAAIRSVHQGDAVCPPRLCRTLFQQIASNGIGHTIFRAKGRAGLTRREQQLVPLISRGLTNKEIAAHLNLSEQTVKNHIHRILQRMGATDRFTAVEIARDRKLLPQA
jgi:two-component system, NarL family, nitrate/nitrite response regulator NarL